MITRTQRNHAGRFLKQKLVTPKFAIVGGYHGVNLGDLALGKSVQNILDEMDLSSGLQTIYNLDRWSWPICEYYIIGGGAVGYEDSLKKLINKTSDSALSKIAFLGVDFNEDSYSDIVINVLKKCAWISCRNEIQKEKLRLLTGRKDIIFHPDLAFSYRKDDSKRMRESHKNKTLLINVVPLYGNLVGGKYVPNKVYEKERPELYQNYQRMIESYRHGIRTLVEENLQLGYRIETIPFTPADELVAREMMEGFEVKHNHYSDNLDKMFKKIGEAQRVFATRYHATIFALKAGAEIIPMAYATKNERLFTELKVDRSAYLSSVDLAEGKSIFPEPFKVSDESVSKWENESKQAISNSIKKMTLK